MQNGIKGQLMNYLRTATGVIGGVALHHYGSEYLSRNQVKAEMEQQNIRDPQINEMSQSIVEMRGNIKSMESSMSQLSNHIESVSDDKISVDSNILEGIKSNVDIISKSGASLVEQSKDMSNKEIGETVSNMVNASQNIKDLLANIYKGGNKFLSDFNFEVYYDYLNSLTQIQEGAFIHVLLFLTIFFSILNILSVLLGNELIQYFKLETKYPKLAIFFRLRVKFQRYYLLYNTLYIVLVCIVSIGFNLLILFN
uniref:LAGLIDADG endonuclease n=1 Tax=Lenzites betulinus TaxID=5632 RepID=UPI003001FBAE|nr:LAGLIDADG endonuclease [Lenzites betulinus]